jgi:cytochrome c oxidase subunit II
MGSFMIRKVVLSCMVGVAFIGPSVHATAADEPRRIEIVAKRFGFSPAEVTIKKGEPVVLVLQSEDVAHGLKFTELDVQADIAKGEKREIAFTPAKAGDFVGHCSHFCGAGHGSMALTLHVTE